MIVYLDEGDSEGGGEKTTNLPVTGEEGRWSIQGLRPRTLLTGRRKKEQRWWSETGTGLYKVNGHEDSKKAKNLKGHCQATKDVLKDP